MLLSHIANCQTPAKFRTNVGNDPDRPYLYCDTKRDHLIRAGAAVIKLIGEGKSIKQGVY